MKQLRVGLPFLALLESTDSVSARPGNLDVLLKILVNARGTFRMDGPNSDKVAFSLETSFAFSPCGPPTETPVDGPTSSAEPDLCHRLRGGDRWRCPITAGAAVRREHLTFLIE